MEDKAQKLSGLKRLMEVALTGQREEDMEYDFWIENCKGYYRFDMPEFHFISETFLKAGETFDKSRMSYGQISYDDYERYKKLRKEGYRKRFYQSLGEDGRRKRSIDKLTKQLAELRKQEFRAKCSGQCLDFNCTHCAGLRKSFQIEADAKERELLQLEHAQVTERYT